MPRVVKLLICGLIFLINLTNLCVGQNVEGKYSDAISGVELELKNYTFKQSLSIHFGPAIVDRGYYISVKDTLLFIYNNPSSNKISIEKKYKRLDSLGNRFYDTYLSIKVIDEKGNDLPGSVIAVRSKENRLLKAFLTDEKGKIQISLSSFNEVDNVLVSWLTDEAQINISECLGYINEITVRLTVGNKKNGVTKGIDKFIILENEKKTLSLKDINSGQIRVYKRIN